MTAPRDFLEDDYSPPKPSYRPRDFLEKEEPEESLGEAAFYAPFRIGEDLAGGAYKAFQNIPEYWEKAKTSVPAFLNPFNFAGHPIERSKNTLAGLLELGQKINHSPKTIAEYAANRLHLIPQDWANKIPVAYDIEPAIEQYLGNPQNPGDEFSRGVGRNANLIFPGIAAARALNPLNFSAKNIAKDVLKARERNMANYGGRYENLWKEAEEKGISDLSHLTNKNDKTYYHGHDEPLIETHHESLKFPDSEFGKGFWTSPEKDVAEAYGNKIHEIKGNFKIFDVNKSNDKELLALYKDVQNKSLNHSNGLRKKSTPPTTSEIKEANESVNKFRDALKNKGYEGIQRLEWESNKPEVMFFERIMPSKSSIKIDMGTIKKYSPAKGIKGLEDFELKPTLQNAHAAKSDLLRIQRDLNKKTTLTVAERQQLKAVDNAIEHINNNMFKNSSGNVNKTLKNKYGQIQEGYKNEVIPYRNKAINEFMRGESSADELVNSLSKRAFYAKRGKYHKALGVRKFLSKHPYLAGVGTGSALGAGALGFYNELFGKK